MRLKYRLSRYLQRLLILMKTLLNRSVSFKHPLSLLFLLVALFTMFTMLLVTRVEASAQQTNKLSKSFSVSSDITIAVRNLSGRVRVLNKDDAEQGINVAVKVSGSEKESFAQIDFERLVHVVQEKKRFEIEVQTQSDVRIDLELQVSRRGKISVITSDGAVDLAGDFRTAKVETNSGTIQAAVPLEAVRYDFNWIASRPRFLSKVDLSKVAERSAGRYQIKGSLGDAKANEAERTDLYFMTRRGAILFGVDADSVPADLRPRALTEAARAIIDSGDKEMSEAIRLVSPQLYREYTHTPVEAKMIAPKLNGLNGIEGNRPHNSRVSSGEPRPVKVTVNVVDRKGGNIDDLAPADFKVSENGQLREVVAVEAAKAPFNLVLLLDVSGSVDERLDFIRKAALDFVDTSSAQDRIAIVSFHHDIKLISDFTTDRQLLKERLRDLEAGGATALYDAIAYTLVKILKPVRSERTAIVILSDGDDNRSFIPFNTLPGEIMESGINIYPVYVPSQLSSDDAAPSANESSDPTRARYLALTTQANHEGSLLARISGGVFYPVTRLADLQRAYDDIVRQLRGSYTITYLSHVINPEDRRLRIKTIREGSVARIGYAKEDTPND